MNKINIRGIQYACVLNSSKFLTRETASSIHSNICETLGIDDLTLAYKRSEDSSAFQIKFTQDGVNQKIQIIIDNSGNQQPTKIILTYTWPTNANQAKLEIDTILKVITNVIDCPSYPLMSEVNLRTDVEINNSTGQEFIESYFLKSPFGFENKDLEVQSASVKLKINSNAPNSEEEANIERLLIIEPLLKDKTKAYVELSSRWNPILEARYKELAFPQGGNENSIPSISDRIEDSIQFISHLLQESKDTPKKGQKAELHQRSIKLNELQPNLSEENLRQEALS